MGFVFIAYSVTFMSVHFNPESSICCGFCLMAKKKVAVFAGQAAFNRLKRHVKVADADRDIAWEYRLGELTDQLCPRGKSVYGSAGIPTLAEELDSPNITANRLWSARKLSAAVPQSELAELAELARANGFVCSASHLLSLGTVKDADDRRSLGAQCVKHKWPVAQLRRAIHRLQGKLSGGGTKVLTPFSVDDALQDLIGRTNQWLSRYAQAWFVESGKSLSRPMSRSARNRLGSELDEAIAVLGELGQAVDVARRRLREQRTGGKSS